MISHSGRRRAAIRRKSEEIEITEAMAKIGAQALWLQPLALSRDYEIAAEYVYRAMERVRRETQR